MAQIDPLVQRLDKRYKTLQTQRSNWEQHWQQLADYMLPRKADIVKKRIEHFFTRYKELEPEKWVKIGGWVDKAAADQELHDSVKMYQEQNYLKLKAMEQKLY